MYLLNVLLMYYFRQILTVSHFWLDYFSFCLKVFSELSAWYHLAFLRFGRQMTDPITRRFSNVPPEIRNVHFLLRIKDEVVSVKFWFLVDFSWYKSFICHWCLIWDIWGLTKYYKLQIYPDNQIISGNWVLNWKSLSAQIPFVKFNSEIHTNNRDGICCHHKIQNKTWEAENQNRMKHGLDI